MRVWRAEQRAEALATPAVRAIPEAWLDELDAAIAHRGPDGCGRFRDRAVRADGCVVDVALVHRRLSIIDHAGGQQPMLSVGRGRGVVTGVKRFAIASALAPGGGLGLYERDAASELAAVGGGSGESVAAGDERVCVVFNGCIYNHRELRAELQRAGHVFSTDHSDTEVLVHGWRAWGDGLFSRLDGMYALAVWDGARGEMVIARDRFGEKPLYLMDEGALAGSGTPLAFASAVPGLARLSARWGVADENAERRRWALAQFVALGWSEGAVPVPGVRECPVDWFMPFGRGRMAGTRDDLDVFAGEAGAGGAGGAAEARVKADAEPLRSGRDVDEAVAGAVASRLEADVPLGCFLSGGVDSSLVALHARRRLGRLSTFTVRMPDARMDESAFAARAAEVVGSEHHVVEAQARPAEDLATLIGQVGVPFGDSSLLAAHWVSRAARETGGLRVAIGGDGGDELFAGYERQRAWRRRGTLGVIARVLPTAWLRREMGSGDAARRARAEKIARLRQAVRSGAYLDLLRIFPDEDLGRLSPALAETARRAVRAGMHDAWRWQELRAYLPRDLMRKVDTASMAVGLEVRSPLLARGLADRACATESATLTRGGRKWMLREAAKRHFPADLIDRPKMGFAIPIGEWFRTDYGGLRTMLLDHLNSSEPFGPAGLGIELNMAYVRQMLDEHLGTGPSGLVRRDHSQRLYMLLVLSVWGREIGRGGAETRRRGATASNG